MISYRGIDIICERNLQIECGNIDFFFTNSTSIFLVNPVPVQRQIVQQYGASECPNNPAEIISNCGDSVPCLYDYTMLNSKTLGIEALNAWNNFVIDRTTGSRHCELSISSL